MSERKFEFTDVRGGAAIGVRVVTRSAATELVGRSEDGALKVRLQSAPAGAPAANDELIQLIADLLGVSASAIEIVAGAEKRDKLLSIEGLSTADVEARLRVD
ncbi:DUF167 domain-containing protein [Phototrophicus methaneseepsis]|uniref:UPF0235 protein G4Y79_12820 n=1 Tax=Phototrophicus methaneseepsis TaxID=2710758 RepID=A0A7S8IBM4_9CHLR|nr:DUF167 domain-containing protein [Phototrophicus methaneseepsis]QPC80595.1 DUF167 domain-containing protein [Phototrophicus methaneseepsis]